MPVARAQALVSAGAIERNTARVARELAAGTELCAVVKSDGYGHGAVTAARAALSGGATWLAVAAAAEATALRTAGIYEPRLIVMGVMTDEELREALAARADVVAWTPELLDALPDHARVHVKLDTGMGRLGTRDGAQATALARAANERGLLAGLMTHFATADEDDDPFFAEQLKVFAGWAASLRGELPIGAVVHAANSAATLRDRAAHFDLVRPGVALYGLDPRNDDPTAAGLEPALRLTSWVGALKDVEVGQSAGYGRRWTATLPTRTATVPIGYGDGWRRALTNNAEVSIGGRRYALVGTVSMDNITVEVGRDSPVAVGDEVVLIGDGITAESVARRLATINYEVTCGLTPRVMRTVV